MKPHKNSSQEKKTPAERMANYRRIKLFALRLNHH
jgi:hypothetical protein